MDAYMVTFPHPYFAVSKKDGTFEIKNVPVGVGIKQKLRIWQEKLTFISNVTINGETKTLKKGRLDALELQPDQVLELDIAIEATEF